MDNIVEGEDAPASAPRGRKIKPVSPRMARVRTSRAASRNEPRPQPTTKRAFVGVGEAAREDPREIEPTEERRLVRNRPEHVANFSIDQGITPRGYTYEWKRYSYGGKIDTPHMSSLRQNHWKNVPSSRHPEMASEDPTGSILIDGMMLMERPDYLTKEARQEAYDNAMGEVRGANARLGAGETPVGTLTRQHQSVKNINRVGKSYEAFDPTVVQE